MTNLEVQSRDEEKVIYLDNTATTFPKPASVLAKANEFYANYGGNAGRGSNPLARSSARLLAETREMLADWLASPSLEKVIFTPSSTHALNQAICGASLNPGDVIYVSPFEHNSILRPIEHLRQTKGILVRQLPFNRRTFECQLDKLSAAFRAQPPAMVCVTQASNVCGVMPPVPGIARLAKEANPQAVIVVDGTQTAGLYPLELNENLIDAFIFSGHKSLYGPYGIAGLVLASTWRPIPLLFGGTGTFSESVEMPTNLPTAYEAGSHNIWATAGLNAALEWLKQTGRDNIVRHTFGLAKYLNSRLAALPNIEIHTPQNLSAWCGITSFTIEGVSPQSLESALGSKGIAVRAGLHCSPWTHKWLGTLSSGGTVRVSPGYFNSTSDIDKVSKVLEEFVIPLR
jgi:cysteine desulfurase family protein